MLSYQEKMKLVTGTHRLKLGNLERQFDRLSSNFDQASELTSLAKNTLNDSIMDEYSQ